jgi:hypothetical protein
MVVAAGAAVGAAAGGAVGGSRSAVHQLQCAGVDRGGAKEKKLNVLGRAQINAFAQKVRNTMMATGIPD